MAIDHDDIERLDERYVRQTSCDDRHKEIDARLNDGTVNFALIKHDLSMIKWGLGIVASTAILELVKSILDLIMRR
ncbi:MAG: hypothetical protein IKP68_08075 [Clostridia bacterium]|nr:hypothetical protein [Clostridia bacterium]